ncbi:MAG: mechanosensitive ion channel family protein [Planctomycetota bacterium]
MTCLPPLDEAFGADPPWRVVAARAPDWLAGLLPDGLHGPDQAVLGVEHWQWIGLFAAVLVGLGVDLMARLGLGLALGRLVKRAPAAAGTRTAEDQDAVARAVRPWGLLAMGLVWRVLIQALALPELPEAILAGAAEVFVVLAGGWAAWRLVDLAGDLALGKADQTDTRIDDVLIPLIRKAAKIFVVVFGVVYAAEALSIELAPLLASLGIGGLAFAFAAKDTIENFFGSVAVLLDRPFSVGDWILIPDAGDGVEGTVEELGFRSTRIRTFYNSQITVPNASLVRAVVDNYGRRQYRRWKTHLGVQYDTPPHKLIAFTEGIRELVRTHPYTRKDYYQVWMHQWSASSMDVLLYVFFEVPDWNTELRERERLFIDIVRLADTLGVQFAFPTQTVHLYREEHADAHATPRHPPPTATTDRRSMVSGIRAAQQITADQPWQDQKPGPQTYHHTGPTPLNEAGNPLPLPPDVKPPHPE